MRRDNTVLAHCASRMSSKLVDASRNIKRSRDATFLDVTKYQENDNFSPREWAMLGYEVC